MKRVMTHAAEQLQGAIDVETKETYHRGRTIAAMALAQGVLILLASYLEVTDEPEVSAAGVGNRHRLLHDDDFLREVARVYREAEQAGSPSVIEAVATAPTLGPVVYSSAQRWVAAARKRQFLPPARRGRRRRLNTPQTTDG